MDQAVDQVPCQNEDRRNQGIDVISLIAVSRIQCPMVACCGLIAACAPLRLLF
jgi:hypothetical protein